MTENNKNIPENDQAEKITEEQVAPVSSKEKAGETEPAIQDKATVEFNMVQDEISPDAYDLFDIRDTTPKEEIQQEEEETVKKKPKKRTKGRAKGCGLTGIWMIGILVVSLLISAFVITFISDSVGVGKEVLSKLLYKKEGNTTVLITVEEGKGINEVAADLKENDLIVSETFFKAFIKVTGKGGDMNYGVHSFTMDMGYDAILKSLAEPALAEDLEVTIKSPMTAEEIALYLEKKNVCDAEEFIHEIKHGTFESELWNNIPKDVDLYMVAEGYLYPDTYRFYENDSPHRVIQKMLDNLEENFTLQMREDAKKLGFSTHEIMSLASMVETEGCGFYDEMPGVSAVFHNRLNDWALGQRFLQSDPSMSYAGGDRYNTYKTEGIPVGPISNVTKEAIHAAIYPDTDNHAYYFVTDKYGKFYYNDTLAGHDSTIADLRARGIWYSKY